MDLFANGAIGYSQFQDEPADDEIQSTTEQLLEDAANILSDNSIGAELQVQTTEQPPESPAPLVENPDDPWLPPQIEDQSQKLQWYEQKYKTLYDTLRDPGYTEFVEAKKAEAYEKALTEAEKDIEAVRVIYQALQTDPINWLRQYVPGAMAAMGVNPVMTQEEMDKVLDQRMAQEFGVGYNNKIVANDIFVPGTLSRNMFLRQAAIQQELQQQNQQNERVFQEWQQKVANGELVQQQSAPVQQQQTAVTPEFINSIYDNHFAGRLEREEMQQFVKDAESYNWGPEDVYNAIYFKEIIETVKEETREEVLKEIYNRGNSEALSSQPNTQQRRTAVSPKGDLVQAFSNNANPWY